jgi:ABC-type transport system involved in cytochrome bd biosynthesis fused ATPase/permease subunit
MTAEWVKILISATVGFFSGLLADLLKTTVADRRKLRRIRFALYNELAFIYTHIIVELGVMAKGKQTKQELATIMKSLKTKAYDSANSQPDLFFQMRDSRYINVLHRALQYIDIPNQTDERIVNICHRFVNLFDIFLRENKINQEVFRQLFPGVFKKSIDKE